MSTLKIKTSDLIGPALNWAVLKADGRKSKYSPFKAYAGTINERITGWGIYLDPPERDEFGAITFEPSEDWAQGGPIIDRENISIDNRTGEPCRAFMGTPVQYTFSMFAPEGMPLIAAMRCFVASKLGDEVDVAQELLVTTT